MSTMSRGQASATQPARLYATEIAQMMFLFGEVQTPDDATVKYVEDITRSRLWQYALHARKSAARRGCLTPNVEDVLFLLRHEPSKTDRLRSYLSWREVKRKSLRGDADIGKDGEALIIDELDQDLGALPPASVPEKSRIKRCKPSLAWDLLSSLSYEIETAASTPQESEEEHDHENTFSPDTLNELRKLDELTRLMSPSEYRFYAECRAASFHHKRARRFRDFLNLTAIFEVAPSDEVIDCFSFLAYESVGTICRSGLLVSTRNEALGKRKRPIADDAASATSKKSNITQPWHVQAEDLVTAPPFGPFSRPSQDRTDNSADPSTTSHVDVPKSAELRKPISLPQISEAERITNSKLGKIMSFKGYARHAQVTVHLE